VIFFDGKNLELYPAFRSNLSDEKSERISSAIWAMGKVDILKLATCK
jgi:hypothetical protein